MKYRYVLIVLALLSRQAYSQTWAEWFQQQKTQIKYLKQQILALQVYGGYLYDGYHKANTGLTAISEIKDGEWVLHKDFFSSLRVVNPLIKSYGRLANISSMQIRISALAKAIIRRCQNSDNATIQEANYIKQVCEHLLKKSLATIEELLQVITSGELEMTDDQRLKRVEGIFSHMQDHFVFIQEFAVAVSRLFQSRSHEGREIELSKLLNQLK